MKRGKKKKRPRRAMGSRERNRRDSTGQGPLLLVPPRLAAPLDLMAVFFAQLLALQGHRAKSAESELVWLTAMHMANALALAVALDQTPEIEAALTNWETRERSFTEYTQDWSAKVARERLENGGRIWSDASIAPARSIPTGTEHLPRLLDWPAIG